MVNHLTHHIFQFPVTHDSFPSHLISLILILNSSMTLEHQVKLSLPNSTGQNQMLALSTAYTVYGIHLVLSTFHNGLHSAPGLTLILRWTLVDSILNIPTILS